jgi:hypothetical protein
MKMYKWLIPALFFLPFLSSPSYAMVDLCPYAEQHPYEVAQQLAIDPDVVPQLAAAHCANIGRRAYNAIGPDRIRETYLGPILRVSLVVPGDIISQPGAPPRLVRHAGVLYMIGPGGIADHIFYRWGAEIAER